VLMLNELMASLINIKMKIDGNINDILSSVENNTAFNKSLAPSGDKANRFFI